MATMADVAREARVSVATVSRLLNNQSNVSPETAARIYAAIEKLAYEPNLLARNLRKSQSRVFLILSPNVTNPFYARILAGIGDSGAEFGYSALIYNTADEKARERKALEMLKKGRSDGAILMSSSMDCGWLLDYADRFPVVQCCEYGPEVDIPHISIDNYKAAQEVMEYLIGLGHRRIAHMSARNDYYSTRLRLDAYRDTLQKYGIEPRDDYIAYASRDYSFKSAKAAARELLAVTPRPTAIFCISDTLALAAIIAAQEMGYQVPQDLTVTGFDDVEYTTMLHPYITTVAQPCYELGGRSAELLFAQITQSAPVPRQVVLEHRLIVRESSGPPPQ